MFIHYPYVKERSFLLTGISGTPTLTWDVVIWSGTCGIVMYVWVSGRVVSLHPV